MTRKITHYASRITYKCQLFATCLWQFYHLPAEAGLYNEVSVGLIFVLSCTSGRRLYKHKPYQLPSDWGMVFI